MTLSEELSWRGFLHQTTYPDVAVLNDQKVKFYWGVDPSADSMTVGNLAAAMLVKCLVRHGHTPVLLVGGATGLIGDPDGKAQERDLKDPAEIARNKEAIIDQYHQIFGSKDLTVVDNYDWFKDFKYLDFLRDIGKHVPMRQMLAREFVQTRLGEDGAGISYAEFSYVLIQAYDYLHLFREHGVTLQLCGSDQWGNCIAGVELVRRNDGGEAHVLSAPLIVNKSTGVKFGKTEAGAVWLDPAKTTPTQFYQFWINTEDDRVEEFLKVFTELTQAEIVQIMAEHTVNPAARVAQIRLAASVTALVHGHEAMLTAQAVTNYLTGIADIGEADHDALQALRQEIPSVKSDSIVEALVAGGLASSNTEARRFLTDNAISVNGQKVSREQFEDQDFHNGRALLRRGKAYKDSALVEK